MRAGQICTHDVAMATPDESLLVAAQRMADQDATDLVVVEELRGEVHPLGMVSEHDLVRALARGSIPPELVSVKDAMRSDVVTVHEDDAVDAALATLTHHGERAVAVVDGNHRVQGVLALDDLVAARTPGSGVGRALGGGAAAGLFGGVIVAAILGIVAFVVGADPLAVLARDTIGLEVASLAALAIFWGATFGLFVYGLGRARTLFAGLLWGAVAWLGMAYVALPILGVDAPSPPEAATIFIGFGVLVAIGFLPFQRVLPTAGSTGSARRWR